jgi:hypothetical protein
MSFINWKYWFVLRATLSLIQTRWLSSETCQGSVAEPEPRGVAGVWPRAEWGRSITAAAKLHIDHISVLKARRGSQERAVEGVGYFISSDRIPAGLLDYIP